MYDGRRAGSSGGYDFSTVKQAQPGPGQLPPPPPFAHAGAQGDPRFIPGMYPPGIYPMAPGMFPPMYPAIMPMHYAQPEPKPSKMPGTGLIMSICAFVPSLTMFIIMLLMVTDIGVHMGWTSDECCFSMVAIWLISIVLSTLAVIFGSIAFWGVKTNRYTPTKAAVAGFVLSIVSAGLSIGTIIMFFGRVLISI